MPSSATVSPLPWLYTAFFLYIEPVATAVGAYYAHFEQQQYMDMTYAPDAVLSPVSTRESIVLTQLANLYFVFALNEALVLRSTTSRPVWNAFLLGLLIADFGHLYSVNTLGFEVYYRFWEWNSMYWGNLGFVYVGALMRSCFLLGIGLPAAPNVKTKI